MSEEKLVPKLRFSGFTDEWNEVKLGDISTFLDNKRIPLKEDNRKQIKGEYPYYGASGIIDYVNDYIFDEELILMGEDGANIVTRSSKLIFLAKGKYWVNNHAHVIKADNNINQYFLSESLERINYEKYNTGTAQPKLNREVCQKIKVKIPQFNEQNKIANFLLVIDEKLRLLEQKYQYYQNFKKYLMQQIFTQKLRFADSDSCWKEISLKDIGTFYRGHSYNSTNVADEGLLVLRSNNIQGNVLDFSEDGLQFVDKDCKKELELQKNDIVICMSNGTRRLVGKSAEYTGNYENKVTVGAFCSIFRTENKLAKYLFQTESYKKNLYLILAGTNINNLKNSDLEKFKFNIPTNESEINKIHDLFVSIDNKIDYNKKQLEEITLFKKGLLQQMFV